MASKEELRSFSERGDKYRVAGEVLKEFIDSRREEIIFDMEHCTSLDEATVNEYLFEMRLMAAFRERISNFVRMGAIAEREIEEIEREMSKNGE